jgi:hypothetical protein
VRVSHLPTPCAGGIVSARGGVARSSNDETHGLISSARGIAILGDVVPSGNISRRVKLSNGERMATFLQMMSIVR